MRGVIILFSVIILSSILLLSACSTKYVCYDNMVVKDQKQCTVYPRIIVTDQSAGIAVDNFGRAVASAKQHQYTRVNLYLQNESWYATVLFADPATQEIYRVGFKINGQTSEVSCTSQCDYLGFE